MDIILLRHGESDSNKSKVYGGTDIKLTKDGIEQARKSKEAIGELDFKKVYVSPMIRARETMLHLGLSGSINDNLREIDLGILEGMTYGELMEKYPKEGKLWTENPLTYALPGGESVIQLYERVSKLLDEIIEKGDSALLICHEGVIKAAMAYVFEHVDCFFRFRSDNLGVSMIRIYEGYKYINYQNRIFW